MIKIRTPRKLTRPFKYDTKLSHLTIRIRSDQEEYLKTKENMGEWIRQAIDEKVQLETNIEQATTKQAVIKIVDIKLKELTKVVGSDFYLKAQRNLTYMENSLEKIKNAVEIYVSMKEDFNRGWLYVDGNPDIAWLDETNIPMNFIVQNGLKFDDPIPKDLKPELLKQLQQYYEYTKNKFQAMKERSSQLQREITELQQKLCNT